MRETPLASRVADDSKGREHAEAGMRHLPDRRTSGRGKEKRRAEVPPSIEWRRSVAHGPEGPITSTNMPVVIGRLAAAGLGARVRGQNAR